MQRWLLHGRVTNRPSTPLLQRLSCSSSPASVLGRQAQVNHHVASEGDKDQLRFGHIEDAEPLTRYRPGGDCPLYVGDVLHRRYHIVHKLGFDSYSTTWLAKDNARNDKYIAIKVKTAESSLLSKETRTWHQLSAAKHSDAQHTNVPITAGEATIAPIHGEFEIDGPNGAHLCIATLSARMSVAEAQDASFTRLFQPRVARAIAAQLIQAVAHMHWKGYVHAGKLKSHSYFGFKN